MPQKASAVVARPSQIYFIRLQTNRQTKHGQLRRAAECAASPNHKPCSASARPRLTLDRQLQPDRSRDVQQVLVVVGAEGIVHHLGELMKD